MHESEIKKRGRDRVNKHNSKVNKMLEKQPHLSNKLREEIKDKKKKETEQIES